MNRLEAGQVVIGNKVHIAEGIDPMAGQTGHVSSIETKPLDPAHLRFWVTFAQGECFSYYGHDIEWPSVTKKPGSITSGVSKSFTPLAPLPDEQHVPHSPALHFLQHLLAYPDAVGHCIQDGILYLELAGGTVLDMTVPQVNAEETKLCKQWLNRKRATRTSHDHS